MVIIEKQRGSHVRTTSEPRKYNRNIVLNNPKARPGVIVPEEWWMDESMEQQPTACTNACVGCTFKGPQKLVMEHSKQCPFTFAFRLLKSKDDEISKLKERITKLEFENVELRWK
jgi:hypothetical protein